MESPPPSEDFSQGFAGPIGGRVDFTPIIEGNTATEEQELKTQLEEYIKSEDSVIPATNTAASLDVVQAFVKFHKGNEVWGSYVGKSFVKSELIDRLCDFFSYTIELKKRLHENKVYMMYLEAQQLSHDIFFVGTVLAGLTKGESAQLYEALNSMLEYKRNQRKLKLGDQPVVMEIMIDTDAFLEGFNPSPGRIRSKVPRITHKMKQRMSAEN